MPEILPFSKSFRMDGYDFDAGQDEFLWEASRGVLKGTSESVGVQNRDTSRPSWNSVKKFVSFTWVLVFFSCLDRSSSQFSWRRFLMVFTLVVFILCHNHHNTCLSFPLVIDVMCTSRPHHSRLSYVYITTPPPLRSLHYMYNTTDSSSNVCVTLTSWKCARLE